MSRRYRLTIDGREFDVEVGDLSRSPVLVVVDGVEYEVDAPDLASSPASVQETTARTVPRRPAVARPRPATPLGSSSEGVVRAPMPGKIVRVNVSAGESVQRGQALVVLESMKMENTVASPRDGVVSSVHVSADDAVQHGQTLVELE